MKLTQIKYFIDKFHKTKGSGRIVKLTTYTAFFSVFIGTFALIISLSILDGFEDKLTSATSKFTSDISVINMKGGLVKNSDINFSGFVNIKKIAPVIEKPIIIRKGKDIDGFLLRGIDYKKDINNFKQNINSGKFSFTSDSAKEVIISGVTAKDMGLSLGDDIIVYTIDIGQKSVPKTKFAKFNVVGIYSTGLGEYDKTVLVAPIKTARDFFDIGQEYATRLEIAVKNKELLDKTSENIAYKLPFPYSVKNVFDFQRAALIWIEVQKEPIPLVLGIITIVATLNVVTMLLILIVEKTKQIGVLKILGMKSFDIVNIFVFIGVRLSLKATVSGALLALILSFLQQQFGLVSLDSKVYFLDKVPISINPIYYLIVIAAVVVITAIVVAIPSIISSRIKPVKVLRFS